MSIRRVFQIVTIVLALAFSFTATSASTTAYACDPQAGGGYC